jgi:glycosidase
MSTGFWAYESVFYQIYPLGFCGAPFENDGVQTHKIKKVEEWIPHMKKLGINAIYFSPVFESILMDTIPGIIRRLMSGSEPIKILKRFVRGYMRMESA